MVAAVLLHMRDKQGHGSADICFIPETKQASYDMDLQPFRVST